MTIDQAIERLTNLRKFVGGDAPLIASKDASGNGFSEVEHFMAGSYVKSPREPYGELEFYSIGDDAIPDRAVRAVFAWPTA